MLPGSVLATNSSMRLIMMQAYGVAGSLGRFKFVEGPREVLEARFNISARAPEGTSAEQIPQMLRALLIERFALRIRTEIRQTAVYALERVREGTEFRASVHNCADFSARLRAEKRVVDDATAPRDSKGRPACGSRVVDDPVPSGAWRSRSAGSIRSLIEDIQAFVDRPIIDSTGLSGNFEWLLLFNPSALGKDSNFPSIYTAVEEQLGLKLQRKMAPFEVFVIERLEWPTPD
jgi:uncharacterized protein (TIGR03435 family)